MQQALTAMVASLRQVGWAVPLTLVKTKPRFLSAAPTTQSIKNLRCSQGTKPQAVPAYGQVSRPQRPQGGVGPSSFKGQIGLQALCGKRWQLWLLM